MMNGLDVNEYHNLKFQDQMVLKNLVELQLSQETDDTTINFRTQNPDFYLVQSRTHTMDKCQNLIERELRNLHNNLRMNSHSYNLSRSQKRALQGGTVVVLDKNDYRSSIETILEDSSTYMVLPSDPTRTFQANLKTLIQEGISLEVLSQSQADYIYVENPVTPILHGLPKVHKGVIPPPMRPIVSGIGSLNERLCEWIDSLLQPLVQK